MTREELIQLLKDELKVSVKTSKGYADYYSEDSRVEITVTIKLGDEEICSDYDSVTV